MNLRGEAVVTPLSSWSTESWQVEKPEKREIPMEEVIAVDWLSKPVAALHRRPQVLLVNGDLIALSVESWDEEALSGTSPVSPDGPLRIPLEFVRGVILHPLADLNELALEMERIYSHPAGDDLVALANGDQVRGQMLRLENGSFLFDRDSTNVSLVRGQIRSLSLNPELSVTPPEITGGSTLISLTDGSCLTVSNWKRTADRLMGSWLGSLAIEIPIDAIAGFRPRGAEMQSLADLAPESYRFVPLLKSAAVELRRNRNTWGGPLSLGQRPRPEGLGVRSRSETTWRLGGEYKSFIATIGIDDAAGNQGSSVCRLIVDGTTVYTSPVLRGGEPPIQIPSTDVARAQRLQIIVDFGEEGDVLDLVDVCDAVLLK
ncbi:MAG: NPCBM/NEW2 domain-containing protein [Planctomycetaceae bacterium]|nr:NPCBM/NEW2 domain-containing protein [Planctomycetaceae bacterium]